MRIQQLVAVALLFVGVGAGCSKNEAPPAGDEPPMSTSAPAPAEAPGSTLPVPLKAPADWIAERPSSSMRQAQYRLPGEGGDAEVAVFTGIGGSPQANVDRWVGQFSDASGKAQPQVATRRIGSYRVTVVDVSGTYHPASMGPMMGGGPAAEPKPGYRMLAAIIEGEGEGRPVFVKLTGPAETVEKWAASFEAYLDSLAGE